MDKTVPVSPLPSPEQTNEELEPVAAGFGASARSAVIWNTGFTVFRDLLQFVLMLVLVRLIPPAAYGQFGLVNSVLAFIMVFSFNNFVAYTLQVKRDHDVHYQEHFTAGGFFQFGAFILTNIAAIIARWIPSYASIAPLLHVMSLIFLLDWPCQFCCRMLEREFDWPTLRLAHASGLILTAILAVVMARLGFGAYALLVPGLLVTIPFTIHLFFIRKWRPTWEFSWAIYRPAWTFGIHRTGSAAIQNARQVSEALVLSALLGFAGLGIFNRAIALATMFCTRFSIQLMASLYPVLTRLEEKDGKAGRVGDLILRLVAWATIPIALSFSLLAEPVIRTIYGTKWLAAVPLVPCAMALGVATAVTQAEYMLLLSRQASRKCLIADIFLFAGTGVALLVLLRSNSIVYLLCLVLVQLAVACVLLVWLHSCGAATTAGIRAAFLPPLTSAFIAAGVALGVRRLLESNPPFVIVAGAGIVLLATYIACLRLVFAPRVVELVRYFPGATLIERLLFLPATRTV